MASAPHGALIVGIYKATPLRGPSRKHMVSALASSAGVGCQTTLPIKATRISAGERQIAEGSERHMETARIASRYVSPTSKARPESASGF